MNTWTRLGRIQRALNRTLMLSSSLAQVHLECLLNFVVGRVGREHGAQRMIARSVAILLNFERVALCYWFDDLGICPIHVGELGLLLQSPVIFTTGIDVLIRASETAQTSLLLVEFVNGIEAAGKLISVATR